MARRGGNNMALNWGDTYLIIGGDIDTLVPPPNSFGGGHVPPVPDGSTPMINRHVELHGEMDTEIVNKTRQQAQGIGDMQ